MSEFLTCRVALGRRIYIGQWREVGELTFVYVGDAWDCARTLHQPPRQVARMLLKRMAEKGMARAEIAAWPAPAAAGTPADVACAV